MPRSLARDVLRRLPAQRRHPATTGRPVAFGATGTAPCKGEAEAGSTAPVHPEAVRCTGCVALTERARLIGVPPVPRHPIAVPGEDKMNRNDLVSHVAAETSVTRVGAERMVAAVFSAIGDALARDEPATIAGFGKFIMRSRAGRQGRNPQTGEPVAIAASRAPSFKAAKALRDAVNG